MSFMFYGAENFNRDGGWDTSNAIGGLSMIFNQDLANSQYKVNDMIDIGATAIECSNMPTECDFILAQ